MNPQILLLTATATGLHVAIFASRIVAVAARPKLDVRGKPVISGELPVSEGCSIALDGVAEPIFVTESLDELLAAFLAGEV